MTPDPVYPPPSTWRFPPPPIGGRWKWIALAASTVATVALVLASVVTVRGMLADSPGLIEDPVVLDTIASACGTMTSSVEALPPGRSPQDRSGVVIDQNRAIIDMIDTIEALPADLKNGDDPLGAWLDDWRDLAEARAAYADQVVRDGTLNDHSIEVPVDDDGRPIVVRMEDALFEDVCRVPEVLVDPDVASDLST